MQTNSQTPATKPQPVVVLGAILAGLVFINGGLITMFADNKDVMVALGVTNVVLGGIAVVKDQIVKGMVVPFDDVVAYANDERQVITGPASTEANGQVVSDVVVGEPVVEDTEPLA